LLRAVDDLHLRVLSAPDATLEEAQENKYRLVFDEAAAEAGDRLLDVGCGWGGMVRYAAATASGASASRCRRSRRRGRSRRSPSRACRPGRGAHGDYRDVARAGFDAVSSIGLTEHIGVHNYRRTSASCSRRCARRAAAQPLHHPPDNRRAVDGGFIDRYVFPDGELTGSGRIITEAQDVGLEVLHEENLRHHYALTLRDWCANLVEHWDEAVEEVGLPTAKVWGLYMAGSRLGFETNVVQLHQVLA
jgi:cyclopropane-fatty-acyl-phospholipid synthase